jgi:hypothetical protein
MTSPFSGGQPTSSGFNTGQPALGHPERGCYRLHAGTQADGSPGRGVGVRSLALQGGEASRVYSDHLLRTRTNHLGEDRIGLQANPGTHRAQRGSDRVPPGPRGGEPASACGWRVRQRDPCSVRNLSRLPSITRAVWGANGGPLACPARHRPPRLKTHRHPGFAASTARSQRRRRLHPVDLRHRLRTGAPGVAASCLHRTQRSRSSNPTRNVVRRELGGCKPCSTRFGHAAVRHPQCPPACTRRNTSLPWFLFSRYAMVFMASSNPSCACLAGEGSSTRRSRVEFPFEGDHGRCPRKQA